MSIPIPAGMPRLLPNPTPPASALFVLAQNAPNPFNPSTEISFEMLRESPIKLQIVDLKGRRVRHLASVYLLPGRYSYTWDGLDDGGRAMPSGVYLYRLATPLGDEYRGMSLVR